MSNTEWLNEWKSDFFRNFTDEVDKENDYYDSQFEEGRPSRVWDFIEGLLAHHRELIVKEIRGAVFDLRTNYREHDDALWEVYNLPCLKENE